MDLINLVIKTSFNYAITSMYNQSFCFNWSLSIRQNVFVFRWLREQRVLEIYQNHSNIPYIRSVILLLNNNQWKYMAKLILCICEHLMDYTTIEWLLQNNINSSQSVEVSLPSMWRNQPYVYHKTSCSSAMTSSAAQLKSDHRELR